MRDLVVQALHGIAGAMLIPDIVLLIGFAAFSLLMLGGLIGEGVSRARHAAAWRGLLRELKLDPLRRLRPDQAPALQGLRARAFRLAAEAPAARERLLDELQLEVERLLDRLMLGVRLGPILGLAGTLIPLGPTLLALTKWDLSALSTQLVVAFNATVVGLFIGGSCFAVHLVRRHWYRGDLADIEFVFSRLE
ncbi:MAG: MotA/TolQ/ExbB proton channel family protein [Burkholderiales bacterium]|nr:MotA/TolQ/ExbB proton channel family protein [Burkholderiales bacterium]